jgi:SAM-dependent methyltransferase
MAKNDPLSESIFLLQDTKNYNNWIYDNIKSFIGQNVLEVGCGIGNITDFLIEKHAKVTGIDIEKDFVDSALEKYCGRKNVKIIHGDFLKLSNLKKNHYDTVVMLNVLEHIKADGRVMQKIYSSLKKGGMAVILVPAMRFAYGELDRELGHYKRYEKNDMKKLFEDAGLKPERMFYMNFIGAFGWALNSRLFKRRSFPRRQTRIFDMFIVPVLKPLEALIRPPVGQSLIAVAKKI